MGVDWLSCEHCGSTFPDCGDFVYCNYCGKRWCSLKCAEADGYRVVIEEDEEYEAETSCKYCRQEDFSDGELLEFALERLDMSREDLISAYKISKQ